MALRRCPRWGSLQTPLAATGSPFVRKWRKNSIIHKLPNMDCMQPDKWLAGKEIVRHDRQVFGSQLIELLGVSLVIGAVHGQCECNLETPLALLITIVDILHLSGGKRHLDDECVGKRFARGITWVLQERPRNE